MAMAAPTDDEVPISFDAFLLAEAARETKHELVDGFARAMAGASWRHGATAANITSLVLRQARDQGCQAFASDMLVRIGDRGYYPDVLVACGGGSDDRFTTEPCLIVEVLSPSTTSIDRGEKLKAYRSIPSVETYLIVDAAARSIEVYQRAGDLWTYAEVSEDAVIDLTCPRMQMHVGDVFDGV